MFQPWDPAGDFPLFTWPHQLGLGWDRGPSLRCSDAGTCKPVCGGKVMWREYVKSDQLQVIAFKVGGLAPTRVTGLDSGLKIIAEVLNGEEEKTVR